jgi:hypothetical protein
MRAYRYTHREFVLGPAPGEFATRGYATPCCQEVVRGLMKGDYRHVGQCAFRAARESDIMVTLLHNTIGVLRSIARQKEGPDITRQALAHARHMQKALKVVETLCDPDWAPPRIFDDHDAKHYPGGPHDFT